MWNRGGMYRVLSGYGSLAGTVSTSVHSSVAPPECGQMVCIPKFETLLIFVSFKL